MLGANLHKAAVSPHTDTLPVSSCAVPLSPPRPPGPALCQHTPPPHPHPRGKWSSASKEEVEAEMAKGTPFCYRFRVPPNKEVRGGRRRVRQQLLLHWQTAGVSGWVGAFSGGGRKLQLHPY